MLHAIEAHPAVKSQFSAANNREHSLASIRRAVWVAWVVIGQEISPTNSVWMSVTQA
jgi:hypothetical protein